MVKFFLHIFMICWHMFLQISNFRKVSTTISNGTFEFFFFNFILVSCPTWLAFMSLFIAEIWENFSTELTRNRSSSGCVHWTVQIQAIILGKFGFLFWWRPWARACWRRLCWLCGWRRRLIVDIRLLILRNYQWFSCFTLELDIMSRAAMA